MDPSRRRFIKYAILAAAGLTVGSYFGIPYIPGGGGTTSTRTTTTSTYNPGNVSPEYAEFLKWLHSVSKPYSGQVTNVALELEPTPLAIQQLALDFHNATGLNDQYDLKPYYLHFADLSLMARTGAPTYDVFDVDNQDTYFFKDHIISPTELADKYPDLTYSKINPDDFQKTAWSLLANYPPSTVVPAGSGGATDILFVPFDMDVMIQFYRNDVFASSNIPAPTSWDEFFQDVKLANNTQTRFGTVNQASPTISVLYEFLNHLASFGGKLWDYDGLQLTSALDSDEALAALQNYVRFVPYSDPGSPTYGWDDVTREVAVGGSASAIQFNTFGYYMNDPLRSKVVGKISYNRNPAGPAGSFSTFGGSGLGVSRYSRHPEAAWLWLQWATSAGAQQAGLLSQFRSYPSRNAVFDQPTVRDALQTTNYAATKVAKQVWDSNQIASLVPFPKWADVLASLSVHLSRAMRGSETPQAALSASVQLIKNKGQLTF